MDKETLSNYGWIVICVLVLAVMLALATPFGNFISTAIKSTTHGLFDTSKNALNSTGLINIGDQSFSDGTGGSGGGNQTTEVKREAGSIIPNGATYTPNGGTAITGNGTNKFPDTVQTGDTYEEGDYIYKYNQYSNGSIWYSESSQNGWGVRVRDTSKTTYGEIISEIAGQQVKNMSNTFYNCTSLTATPTIPSSVTDMEQTFCRCTSLTTAPTIPNSVKSMQATFSNCTSLATAPIIPNSVKSMYSTFYNCHSLKTYVGSTDTDGDFSNYTIPNRVTKMESTFEGCTSLTAAPTIPNSVTNINKTFYGCTSLTGTIEVNAFPNAYYSCLYQTQITGVTGSCPQRIKDTLMRQK